MLQHVDLFPHSFIVGFKYLGSCWNWWYPVELWYAVYILHCDGDPKWREGKTFRRMRGGGFAQGDPVFLIRSNLINFCEFFKWFDWCQFYLSWQQQWGWWGCSLRAFWGFSSTSVLPHGWLAVGNVSTSCFSSRSSCHPCFPLLVFAISVPAVFLGSFCHVWGLTT